MKSLKFDTMPYDGMKLARAKIWQVSSFVYYMWWEKKN